MIQELGQYAAKLLKLTTNVETHSKQIGKLQAQVDRLTEALASTVNELKRQRDRHTVEIQALKAQIESNNRLVEAQLANVEARLANRVQQAIHTLEVRINQQFLQSERPHVRVAAGSCDGLKQISGEQASLTALVDTEL